MTSPPTIAPDDLTHQQLCALVRADIVRMCAGPEGGHVGGSMSCVEALVGLYFAQMRLDPSDPVRADRDILIMSKGHASLAHYAVLARRGYFSPADLDSYARSSSRLSPHANPEVPGIEAATGSLGHGLGLGLGHALARKLRNDGSKVYVILGDGELQEGSCWEAAQVAATQSLGNLVALVDANGGQQSGHVGDISSLEPLGAKWAAFGWLVREVEDGNDVDSVVAALAATSDTASTGQPTVLILRTVKAHGIPMLAGKAGSHFVSLTPSRLSQVQASMAAAFVETTGVSVNGQHT